MGLDSMVRCWIGLLLAGCAIGPGATPPPLPLDGGPVHKEPLPTPTTTDELYDAGAPMPGVDAGAPALPEPIPCGGLDYLGECVGDVARWCSDGTTVAERDCAAEGRVCRWIDDQVGYYCTDPLPTPIDAGPPTGSDAGPGASDAGPGSTGPTSPVGAPTCQVWGEQHTSSDGSWGSVLTDIVRRLPTSYGSTYYDPDHVTYGHETSHGIHSHIRNHLNTTGERANGFYLPGGQACLVREPRMRKSAVAAYVPSNLRGSRYSLYITGSSAWDDTPLYVWDEWNAYVNGAEVGLDRASAGLWTSGWRGTVDGVIEFVVYGVAVGMAAEAAEPGYFMREPNFLRFLAHELERSMTAFRAGQTHPLMSWADQDAYYDRLRTSPEAAPMRDWIRARFGAAWTTRVMGF